MERRKTPRYHLDEEDVDYTTETDYTYSLPSSTFESDFIGSPPPSARSLPTRSQYSQSPLLYDGICSKDLAIRLAS